MSILARPLDKDTRPRQGAVCRKPGGAHPLARPIAVILVIVFTLGLSAKEETKDLTLIPGQEGFVSSWLVLGPIKAPPYIEKKRSLLAKWNPIKIGSLKKPPAHGDRSAHGQQARDSL